MESIHGVDVSWLHRPTNGHPNSTSSDSKVPQLSKSGNEDRKAQVPIENEAKSPVTNGTPQTPPQPQQTPMKKDSKRPGILSRSASEKPSSTAAQDDAKSPPKKSWMSSLTSKLSSQSTKPSSGKSVPEAPAQSKASASVTQASRTSSERSSQPAKTEKAQPEPQSEELFEETFAAPEPGSQPNSPKAANQSFFSSAFRRLSTSTTVQTQSGSVGLKPQTERRILNVDEGRPRCAVKGLNQAKLRRVSFSVDVEIAGSSRYATEDDEDVPQPADNKAKNKDKKLKERGEGEAMKHPDAAVKVKEEKGDIDSGVAKLNRQTTNDSRSEPQGPEAKQTETRPTPEDGMITPPPEYNVLPPLATSDLGPQAQLPANPASTNGKSHDRPTTDPLRIYRRCCQLREAPVLKRISEQLGNPNNVGIEAPGVVTCLNLNKSRLQFTDVVCLGDWLAVVPVKKLLFDEANLTDEGVRVVLAGLLAAKPAELHKRKRGRSSPTRLRDSSILRTPGVIEKLTLKGNRKLTFESWKHICLFLNLCKSITACDLSGIPFPASTTRSSTDAEAASKKPQEIAELLYSSLLTRMGGARLCELTFHQCDLDDYSVSRIAAAAAEIRLSRLGLAGNHFTDDGLAHIATYLRAGVCKGLDLGGIDLHGRLPVMLDAIAANEPLQALSLAQCGLEPAELKGLFEKLATLSDFRFLDLSHNDKLFSSSPSALSTLRHYLPKLQLLKRLHLMDVSLSPADVIGIAEIVPEIRNLAHLNVLENSLVKDTVAATDSASSEEACALYASLMTAVRLSKTLVCVDIDVPGQNATEVVKSLARQVIAYCLRNLEVFAQGDAVRITDAAAALPDVAGADRGVLKDIARGPGGGDDTVGLPESANNEDLLVGGSGWCKALNHVLNASDLRRMSADGGTTPSQVLESEAGRAQAKEMSKDLLSSARAFKIRLEAVLAREEASSHANFDVLKRLQFLDHTILSIIERFEREFPETRVFSSKPVQSPPAADENEAVDFDAPTSTSVPDYSPFFNTDASAADHLVAPPSSTPTTHHGSGSRRGSATDLAAFAQASEEANILRFGQRFRREILPPKGQDDLLHGTTKDQVEPIYDAELRRRVEEKTGEELQDLIRKEGYDAVLQDFREEKEKLRKESLSGGTGEGMNGEVMSGPYKGS